MTSVWSGFKRFHYVQWAATVQYWSLLYMLPFKNDTCCLHLFLERINLLYYTCRSIKIRFIISQDHKVKQTPVIIVNASIIYHTCGMQKFCHSSYLVCQHVIVDMCVILMSSCKIIMLTCGLIMSTWMRNVKWMNIISTSVSFALRLVYVQSDYSQTSIYAITYIA